MNAVRVRPTRRLAGFLMLLSVLWLVSANYRNNLGYLLTYLLAGIGAASWFQTRRQLAGLRCRFGKPAPVFAGETAALPLWIEAAGGGRPQLRLEVPGGAAENLFLEGAWRVTLSFPAGERGRRRVGPLRICSTFPLGLFRAEGEVEGGWLLWVYPRPAAQAPPPKGAREGDGGEREFEGFRSYRPGDSPRQIHWKGLAKGQGLVTKVFSEQGGESGAVFDWEMLPPAAAERRLGWLARWLLDAERQRRAYGLRLPGVSLPVGGGAGHLEACLKALAEFPGGERD